MLAVVLQASRITRNDEKMLWYYNGIKSNKNGMEQEQEQNIYSEVHFSLH